MLIPSIPTDSMQAVVLVWRIRWKNKGTVEHCAQYQLYTVISMKV